MLSRSLRGTPSPRQVAIAEKDRTGLAPRIILMSLFALWSGALAVGFGYAVVVGAEDLGTAKAALFVALTVLLGAAAVRTAYELVRHLRTR